MPDEFCVAFVTVGKADEAARIAETLVGEHLVACCNLIGPVRSIYRWKGELCREEETLMLLKTRRALFERMRARIAQLHSYSVPEIIALPIIEGHAPYLDWIRDETT